MIINVLCLNECIQNNFIQEAFSIVKKSDNKIFSAERRNIIRDGIGEKMVEALTKFPSDNVDNKAYHYYVETMLRTALLYYDQALYIKVKDLSNHLLIDWGAEGLYIYLLSAIKNNSTKDYTDISNWLDKVFQPIIFPTHTIVPCLPSEPVCIDPSILAAYEYVKRKNAFNFFEYQLEPTNSAECLSMKITDIKKTALKGGN